MIVGFVSDAHGNPLGLRACLDALRRAGAELIYFLGDAVGYLPGEVAVLRLLSAEGVQCQQGNHEAMLLGELPLDPVRDETYQLAAARARLGASDLAALREWPRLREIDLGGRRVLLAHGSPTDPLQGYVFPDTDLDGYQDLGYDAVILGNTHRPFVAYLGEVLVANAGSCGLPRDRGDLAACVVYDADTGRCQILRVRVPADAVLAQFPSHIRRHVHPAVDACLRRDPPDVVGTIVGPN